MRCPSEDTLARLLDEQLSVDESRRIHRHLRECTVCSRRAKAMEALIAELASPVKPKAPADEFVDSVMGRLSQQKPRLTRRASFLAAAACLALLAGAVFLTMYSLRPSRPRIAYPSRDPGRFQARGRSTEALSALVGAEPYIVSSRSWRRLMPDGRLAADEGFAFKVTNLLRRHVFLMAFGLDSRGQVHWFYPAYLDERQNPAAVRIEPGVVDQALPEAVRPESCPEGRLRIAVLFSLRRRTVKEVEYSLKGFNSEDSLNDLFAEAFVQQWLVSVPAKTKTSPGTIEQRRPGGRR